LEISTKLKAAGLQGKTPCALISRASTLQQQVQATTVDRLRYVPQIPAPALLVVGEVVRFADEALLRRFVVPTDISNEALSISAPLADFEVGDPGTDQEPIA
jgi:siroheme synthase